MTKSYLLPVEVQKLESGRYLAICEVIQGCHAEGDTVAEALENLEDVARILLELREKDGLALPEGLRKQRAAKGGVQRGAAPLAGVWGCPPDSNTEAASRRRRRRATWPGQARSLRPRRRY